MDDAVSRFGPAPTSRWKGTQLGVGVLGRHRRCCIELAAGGVLRLLAENTQQNDGQKTSWIRLSNRRTTVLYDCWVEDLSREAEVKPRKSKPDLNSVQLSLPQHMRQLPIAAARQKGGGRGGNGDKADCQPRWQGADKPAEPLVIRVTLDGGRESEQEACKLINDAGREYGRRRAGLKLRVAALLELRQTCFSPSNALHTQQLTDLWHLALGDGAPSPPSCMPADGARSEGCAAPDWGNLGFQNRLCPQSDFRDMGMLSVHLLTYYARKYRQEVASLVLANSARAEGYPFAAAAINVGHMLVKMLVQGLAPEEEALLCALRRPGAPSLPSSSTVLLRSPLFVVMSRIVEDSRDLGGGQGDGGAGASTDGDSSRDSLGCGEACGWVLEEMFCAAFGLLEQLWVRHEAKYMMFNRILGALSKCMGLYVQDEWRQPTGSLNALRDFDVSRVQLPPDPMSLMHAAVPSSPALDASSSPSRPSSLALGTGNPHASPMQTPLSKSAPHPSSSPAQQGTVEKGFLKQGHDSSQVGSVGNAGQAPAHAAAQAGGQGGSATGVVTGGAVGRGIEGGHSTAQTAFSPSSPRARLSVVSLQAPSPAPLDSRGSARERSWSSSTGSVYGPGMLASCEGYEAACHAYEGAYDAEGHFSRYLTDSFTRDLADNETSGDAASLVAALQAEGLDTVGSHAGSDAGSAADSTSPAATPPSEVDDAEDHVDAHVDLEWSPSGNMV